MVDRTALVGLVRRALIGEGVAAGRLVVDLQIARDGGQILALGMRAGATRLPLASASILAESATDVVSSSVGHEVQNVSPLAQSAGHERYVLGRDGLSHMLSSISLFRSSSSLLFFSYKTKNTSSSFSALS